MKRTLNSLGVALLLGASIAALTGLCGCAGSRYERSTGEYIDDKSLTSRVKGALADHPQYKYEDVHVETFRGVVQLSGFVNSTDQKRQAKDIAAKVQGVKEVENNITVKEKGNS
jgi:osmotically-inducible protein OsmY